MKIIYGTGATGKTIFAELEQKCSKRGLCFADSNPSLWGTTLLGVPIINPNEIPQMEYEKIIIASIPGYETISNKLQFELAVPADKIDKSFVQNTYERTYETRDCFLKRFAEIIHFMKIDGAVAEGGVFEGNFAKQINAAFPDRRLYLFDTFKGFDQRDIAVEQGDIKKRATHYNIADMEAKVMSSMPHAKQVVIRKGYFPETAHGIEECFVFVNLDFDLYNPTLAGLEFFYPKLVKGGVVLIHDYFQGSLVTDPNLSFQGVRKATNEFCEKHEVAIMPIGDDMSVAMIKG